MLITILIITYYLLKTMCCHNGVRYYTKHHYLNLALNLCHTPLMIILFVVEKTEAQKGKVTCLR